MTALQAARAAQEDAVNHEAARRIAHEQAEDALRLLRTKQTVAEEEKAETNRLVADLQARLAAAEATRAGQEKLLRSGHAANAAERTAGEHLRELQSKDDLTRRERMTAALRVAELEAAVEAAEQGQHGLAAMDNMDATVAERRRGAAEAEERLLAQERADRQMKAEHDHQIHELETRLTLLKVWLSHDSFLVAFAMQLLILLVAEIRRREPLRRRRLRNGHSRTRSDRWPRPSVAQKRPTASSANDKTLRWPVAQQPYPHSLI